MSHNGGSLFGALLGGVIAGIAQGTAAHAISNHNSQSQQEKMNQLAGPDPSQINAVKIICPCGQQMVKTPYESVYGCKYDENCDKCLKWMGGQKYVHFCSGHDVIKYPNGFAICYSCTQKIIKQTKLNQLQQETQQLYNEIEQKMNKIPTDNSIICGSNIHKIPIPKHKPPPKPSQYEEGDDVNDSRNNKENDNSAFMANFKNGWMYKQGWYNTAWKKRYFELNGVLKTLTYYTESNKPHGPKYKMQGFIDFKKTPITKMKKTMKDDEFHVKTTKREWVFKCDTKTEMEEWYNTILTLCTGK